jgi:TetR/AcrR family transcriptional regulator
VPHSSPVPSDNPTSRERILEATAMELAERGHDGVRIEHVAKRAKVNKALVYRWFGDREALFASALRAQYERRAAVLQEAPASLADALRAWTAQSLHDPVFTRLLVREALKGIDPDAPHTDVRHAYYQRQLEQLRSFVDSEPLDPELDVEMLYLALASIVFMPAAMQQVVWLATGLDPRSEAFAERWGRLLDMLVERLGPR